MRTSIADDALVIAVTEPRIDAAAAISFKDTVIALAAGAQRRVILDLSHVGFIDSSGLGAVVSVMKQLAPGQRLELAGLTPNVRRVMQLTHLDRVFVIHDEAPARSAARL